MNYLNMLLVMMSTLLTKLNVYDLQLVFPALETLNIEKLKNISEIWEEHGRLEESSGQLTKILFPQLKTIDLTNLPNLKSFSSGTNCSFQMPLLKKVGIHRCPQMLSFTFQKIISSGMNCVNMAFWRGPSERNYFVNGSIADINNHLQQFMNAGRYVFTRYYLYSYKNK